MSKEAWSTCNTRHVCYQSTTKGIKKQTCSFSVRTTRLNLDASCNENGANLFSNPTPCLLVPIIIKYNKLVTMEAQTFLDSSALTCFIDKESVVIQVGYNEKNTLVLIEVIDSRNFSLGPITHETKALDFTFGFHTNKVVFNVISFLRNLVIIGLFWLALYNPQMD